MAIPPQKVVENFIHTLVVEASVETLWQYVCSEGRQAVSSAIQRTHDDNDLQHTRLYYQHAECDLSGLRFVVVHQDDETTIIQLTGKVYARYLNARFSISPERIFAGAKIYLSKIDGQWLVCFPAQV